MVCGSNLWYPGPGNRNQKEKSVVYGVPALVAGTRKQRNATDFAPSPPDRFFGTMGRRDKVPKEKPFLDQNPKISFPEAAYTSNGELTC